MKYTYLETVKDDSVIGKHGIGCINFSKSNVINHTYTSEYSGQERQKQIAAMDGSMVYLNEGVTPFTFYAYLSYNENSVMMHEDIYKEIPHVSRDVSNIRLCAAIFDGEEFSYFYGNMKHIDLYSGAIPFNKTSFSIVDRAKNMIQKSEYAVRHYDNKWPDRHFGFLEGNIKFNNADEFRAVKKRNSIRAKSLKIEKGHILLNYAPYVFSPYVGSIFVREDVVESILSYKEPGTVFAGPAVEFSFGL